MKDLRKVFTLLFVLVAVITLVAPASAQPVESILVTVDEFGNSAAYFNGVFQGGLGLAVLAPDPGPGGLPSVLTYSLNATAVVPGDVRLIDADFGSFLDVVRFNLNPNNNTSTLLFYSDNVDGFDAPADTPSSPTAFYTNLVSIPEVGSEAFNYAMYSPTPGQPGYFNIPDNGGNVILTYKFISDSTVPEPSTILLLGAGLAGVGLFRRRFKK